MNLNPKKLISGLTMVLLGSLFLILGLGLSPVRADLDKEVARDLSTINREIKQSRKQENRARLRQDSILRKIDELNRLRIDLKRDIEQLNEEAQVAKMQVEEQKIEGARLEDNLDEVRQKFCQRLKIRYRQPPGKWLDFLDSNADLTENLNSLVYARRVLEADKRLQQSYLNLLGEIQERNSELEKRHLFLARLKREQADKIAALEENIAKKNELLYKIKHQVEEHRKLVAELEEVAAQLKRMPLENASTISGFVARKGNLPMPVDGTVVSFFGIEKDSRFATVTRNKGIEIETESDSPVRVVYQGDVVFASWMKGYGNLLVVNHGGGYYSVYAHLDKFACTVNDHLQALDVVGRVGQGQFSDTPSLYFEIRKDGVPEDPLIWI
jgi:septal ring factor EnvC (AmiA/AmiB activator)